MRKAIQEKVRENVQVFKKIRSYNLDSQAIAKVEKKARQLTQGDHGKSAVVGRMIDFAMDNEQDFDAFFAYKPNPKGDK